MNYLLTQLILAARKNNEDNGWMQILVFVILAVFYALGSILKVKANKAASKGKEQKSGKPVRKPPELTIDLQRLRQLFGLSEEHKQLSHRFSRHVEKLPVLSRWQDGKHLLRCRE
jgi:hypothetical protein